MVGRERGCPAREEPDQQNGAKAKKNRGVDKKAKRAGLVVVFMPKQHQNHFVQGRGGEQRQKQHGNRTEKEHFPLGAPSPRCLAAVRMAKL